MGLLGTKGVGKDTVADYMISHYNFDKRAFASPIKEACAILFQLPIARFESEGKELCDEKHGLSPRQMMQLVGTDFFRDNAPIRTLCLVVILVALHIGKRAFMPLLDQDICFAPSHITAATTWAELAKRWVFHSLFHLHPSHHLVMNVTLLAQLGQYLEKTHGVLLGKELFLRSTLFLWTVLPAIYFLIAKAFQMRLDSCIVGFSGVLYGLLMIKLYLEHRDEVAWKWLISKGLLYAFTAPIAIDALNGSSTSHLAHASGIFGGLIYLAIFHVSSSRPAQQQEETTEVQPRVLEKEKERKTRTQATKRQEQGLPASVERRQSLRPKSTLPARTRRSEDLASRPSLSSVRIALPPPALIAPVQSDRDRRVTSSSHSTALALANDKKEDPMDVVKESSKRKRTDKDKVVSKKGKKGK